MKHVKILLAALFFSVSAQAQTTDTAMTILMRNECVKIKPVQVNQWIADSATSLLVYSQHDNFYSACTMFYELLNAKGDDLFDGTITVTGTDYVNWAGDNVYPFTYVAGKLKLTLK